MIANDAATSPVMPHRYISAIKQIEAIDVMISSGIPLRLVPVIEESIPLPLALGSMITDIATMHLDNIYPMHIETIVHDEIFLYIQ